MNLLDARRLDIAGRMEEAAREYEAICAQGNLGCEGMVDLCVLYWEATDLGVASADRLSLEFTSFAGHRWRTLLDEAIHKCPDHPSVRFWHRYVITSEQGEDLPDAEWQILREQYPDYLEPLFVPFVKSGGVRFRDEALRLLEQCRRAPTARARFVASMIGGMLNLRTGKRADGSGA